MWVLPWSLVALYLPLPIPEPVQVCPTPQVQVSVEQAFKSLDLVKIDCSEVCSWKGCRSKGYAVSSESEIAACMCGD